MSIPAELDQSVKPSIAIEADADEAAVALLEAVEAGQPPTAGVVASRTDAARALGARLRDGLAARFPDLASCCEQLRAAIPEDGVLVDEMTQVGYYARTAIPSRGPASTSARDTRARSASGSPRASVPRSAPAIAWSCRSVATAGFCMAWVSSRRRRNTRSLWSRSSSATTPTATCCACSKRAPATRSRSRLQNPDLVRLAESFGVAGHRVTDLGDLRATIERAIESGGPALVDVPIGPQPDLWGLLTLRERLA